MTIPPAEPTRRQPLTARGGAAYGVVGADLHVHVDQDSGATTHRLASTPGGGVGADLDLGELRQWIRRRDRLAGMLVHGADGARNAALATAVGAEQSAVGWLVVSAGRDTAAGYHGDPLPDMDQIPALLVIVEQADTWSRPELTWLLSDALLHHPDVTTRVLLTAATMDMLPTWRGVLANLQIPISVWSPSRSADV
jgi:hypothetical protein